MNFLSERNPLYVMYYGLCYLNYMSYIICNVLIRFMLSELY
jgi:hypothetical protein